MSFVLTFGPISRLQAEQGAVNVNRVGSNPKRVDVKYAEETNPEVVKEHGAALAGCYLIQGDRKYGQET